MKLVIKDFKVIFIDKKEEVYVFDKGLKSWVIFEEFNFDNILFVRVKFFKSGLIF